MDEVNAAKLARTLEGTSPTAAEIVREHIEDNDEVLPTLLLADVGRWYLRAQTGTDTSDAADAARAVQAISDCHATGDDSMQTIVATGFLEAMPYPHEEGREIVERLPGPLREELRAMENAQPPR